MDFAIRQKYTQSGRAEIHEINAINQRPDPIPSLRKLACSFYV